MILSTQNSDDKRKCNNKRFANRIPKPFIPKTKSKLENLLNPNNVMIIGKSIMLAKMKNSRGKPISSYAYKVQTLGHNGRKKPKKPQITRKTGKSKEYEDMFDEDFSTQSHDDDDLTPRNRVEPLIAENSYETSSDENFDFDLESSDDDVDLESSDDLSIWYSVQGQATLSMDCEITDNEPYSGKSLAKYPYQSTEEASFNWKKNLNGIKLVGENSSKTFRSQETSTNDLFKFRKLSTFASAILQKCQELEQMQFNARGYSQEVMCLGKNRSQPRLPTIPEESVPTKDYSDNKLSIYEGEGKPKTEKYPTSNFNSNTMRYSINSSIVLAILGLISLIVGIIYIHYQMRPAPPPKPFWRQYF